MKKTSRNYFIEGLRFLFAVAVVVAHYRSFYPENILTGKWSGHISVEFFFVLSGLLMAAYCTNYPRKDEPLARATWSFMKKKLGGIAPAYYCALIICVVHYVATKPAVLDKPLDFLARLMPSVLMIPSQGLKEIVNVPYSWYIGAMVVGMLVLFPLVYRWKRTFTQVAAPLLVLFYCQWAVQTYGKLFLLQQDWMGICWPQLLRAVAGMCLGCVAYEVSTALNARFAQRITSEGRVMVSILGGALLLVPFPWIVFGISAHSHVSIFLMFALGVALSFSGLDHMDKLGEVKWCRTLLGLLGKLSLPLYLGQGIVMKFFPKHLVEQPRGIYLFLLACCAMAVALLYGGKLLTLAWNGFVNLVRAVCLGETAQRTVPAEESVSATEPAEKAVQPAVKHPAPAEKAKPSALAQEKKEPEPVRVPTKITKRGLMETVATLLVLVFVLNQVNGLLLNKSGGNHVLVGQAKTDATYDVIFAGSSHMNNALYPMEIWEDHGFTSFNNAQSGEIIPVSYYTCKEAIEKYDPSMLVLDVYMLYHPRADGSISWMHQSLDRLSAANRIPAILDLVPLDHMKEFLFPMTLYHSRWNELTKTDFVITDNVRRGCAQNFTIAEDIVGLTHEYVPADVKVRPSDIPVEYLDKIVELCEQTDTTLVLVALPYFMSADVKGATHKLGDDQAYFNWVSDYASEHGLDYINYFHLVDEIGFDWYQCLYNHSHMNYWGGTIITEHLGAYLAENYDLPDRREDSAYQHWNKDLETYNKQVEKNLEKAAQ